MIDTHAHILKEYYKEDFEKVMEETISKLEMVFNIAFNLESSKEVSQISKEYKNVYNVIGIHPNDSMEFKSNINDYKELVNEKTVAIGEIGLDYHYEGYNEEIQKKVFKEFIMLAKEMSLPVVVHSRDANEDTIEIIKEFPEVKFLFHS
jgi:TatD DNase family protein